MSYSLDTTVSDEPTLMAQKDDNSKKVLVRRRSPKRQSITDSLDKIAQGQAADAAKISFYKQKLTTLLSEFSVLDVQIEKYMLANILWSDLDFLRQSKVTEKYSDSLTLTLAQLNSVLTEALPTHNPSFAVPIKREYISRLMFLIILFSVLSGEVVELFPDNPCISA